MMEPSSQREVVTAWFSSGTVHQTLVTLLDYLDSPGGLGTTPISQGQVFDHLAHFTDKQDTCPQTGRTELEK
jgi:hypothetical protein